MTLTFQYVQWRHGDEGTIAYVPALGIEVLAENDKQLAEQLVPQIRSALARRKTAESLKRPGLAGPGPRPARQAAAAEGEAADAQAGGPEGPRPGYARKNRSSRNVPPTSRSTTLRPIYERDEPLRRLAELLTARLPRSVLLVGPSGCGKTALVHELARRRADFALGHTPLWTTSGSRLVAGMSGFGMWQERCEKLVREASQTKAIVHLDNLVELIEVGKGGGNTQGIAAVLRPAIARGTLLAICECTPEQLAIVEREDPQLLEAFAQLEIAEPTPDETRTILRHVAAEACARGFTGYVSRGAWRRSIDCIGAMRRTAPRRAGRCGFCGICSRIGGGHASIRNATEGVPYTPWTSSRSDVDVTAAFSQETGLPLFMLDDSVPLDLAATRDWFRQRVIGQPEPVELVVDLLAAVKAGLSRGGKPIASLLFIGPTGVGKTEMAKALAEFLYQDPGRMIRFDMSEYAHPAAVERLIGGSACSQGLLTQKVRDQPFMVVLLDEFEKAHPLLFDVLLQVLGEGG